MRYLLCKPEVSDLPHSSFQENVGRFEVPVYYVLAAQVLTSLRQLVGYSTPFQMFLGLGIALKISALTVLRDKVAVVCAVKYVYQFEDVGVFKLLKDGDFAFEEEPVLGFDVSGFDDFNGIEGLLLRIAYPFVDFSAIAGSDQLVGVVAVLANLFLVMLFVTDFILFFCIFNITGAVSVG